MIDIMNWNVCVRNFVRKVEVDYSKISSLLKTANLRFRDINNKKVTEDNVSSVIEGYYEVIKELLVSLMLAHGFRSKNHQCLISFLYKYYPKYEGESYFISQLSFHRNRLNYYGELIDFDFYKLNKKKVFDIVDLLNKLVQDKIK